MLSLAAKLRPKHFRQVVGQDLVCKIILQGLTSEKLSSVCLFSGPAGTGKTTIARLIALWLVCTNKQTIKKNTPSSDDKQTIKNDPPSSYIQETYKEACLSCENCKAALLEQHPDIMEFDAATNTGIDDIKECLAGSSYQPQLSNKKIYIIDEAHMLSKSAISALLKIIEEPSANVWFLLATTDLEKIPYTIISRCLAFKLHAIQNQQMEQYLAQVCQEHNYGYEPEALQTISQASQGCLRAALSKLEQCSLLIHTHQESQGIKQSKITHEIALELCNFVSNTILDEIYSHIKNTQLKELQLLINQTLQKTNPFNITMQLLEKAIHLEDTALSYQMAQVLEELAYSPCPEKVLFVFLSKAAFIKTLPSADQLWKALKTEQATDKHQTPSNTSTQTPDAAHTNQLLEKAKILFGK